MTENQNPVMLMLDVSKWNTGLDWRILKEGGAGGVLVKISQGNMIVDPRAEQHIAEARAAGLLVGAYHWDDPNIPALEQLELVIQLMEKYELQLCGVDEEQCWKDWGEWYRGEITQFIEPIKIDRSARNLYYGLIQHKYNALIYTRKSFVDAYAPMMWDWLKKEHGWYAHYPYSGGRLYTSWKDLMERFLPTKFTPPMEQPTLPAGCDWDLWQFSGDKFILPGTGGSPIDLNLPKDMNEMRRLFGAAPVVEEPGEPAPEEPEVTNIRFETIRPVYIRTGPTTASNRVRTRQVGEIIRANDVVLESLNRIWVQDDEGWSAMVHNGIQFMR